MGKPSWEVDSQPCIRLGYFAAMYKRITIAVRTAVNNGAFQDGPRMERFDAAFAGRYFDALNGYFQNRLNRAVSPRQAPILSAALFSGVHLPNWFLMAVTLLLGYCSARIYNRYRNLYFLGVAHGTLGVLLYLVVPDSVSHHLAVGPGWFGR